MFSFRICFKQRIHGMEKKNEDESRRKILGSSFSPVKQNRWHEISFGPVFGKWPSIANIGPIKLGCLVNTFIVTIKFSWPDILPWFNWIDCQNLPILNKNRINLFKWKWLNKCIIMNISWLLLFKFKFFSNLISIYWNIKDFLNFKFYWIIFTLWFFLFFNFLIKNFKIMNFSSIYIIKFNLSRLNNRWNEILCCAVSFQKDSFDEEYSPPKEQQLSPKEEKRTTESWLAIVGNQRGATSSKEEAVSWKTDVTGGGLTLPILALIHDIEEPLDVPLTDREKRCLAVPICDLHDKKRKLLKTRNTPSRS